MHKARVQQISRDFTDVDDIAIVNRQNSTAVTDTAKLLTERNKLNC